MLFSKRLLSTLGLTGLLATGCGEKYLDEQPRNAVTDANFYQTQNDAIQAVTAVYSELTKGGQYNYALWGIGDIGSDNSETGGGGGADGIEFQQLDTYSIPTTNGCTSRLWGGSYVGIGRANIVLERVPNIAMDAAIKARCLGEAKFMRAKYYFDLVRVYGDVPLIIKTPSSLAEVNVPRNPVAEVYPVIIKDLTEAVNELPATYGSTDKGRATKWAAAALLAKVYLTTGDKANAAIQARNVINSGLYSLWANYGDNFKISNENGQESLFEVQYRSGLNGYTFDGLGSVVNEYFGPRGGNITPQGGYGLNIPTQEFVQGYEAGDTRKAATIWAPGDAYPDGRKQPATLPGSPFGYNVKKWFIGKTDTNIWDSGLNVPVMRLAEVYLILAEAVGPTAEGLEAINKVRRRAFGLPINTPSVARDLTAATPNFSDAVLRERRYELAFEDDRWFDLKRTGKLVSTMRALGKSIQDYNNVLPIPRSETDINSGLTQNPGY